MKLTSLNIFGFGGRAAPTLGLDIGSHAIKLVELSGSEGNRTVRRIGSARLPKGVISEGMIKEPEFLTDTLKVLLKNLEPRIKRASVSIAGYSVIVKRITVPYATERDIEDNLAVEAENYVPFEIDEVYLDFHIIPTAIPSKENTSEIFLVVAKKEIVDAYASALQSAGLVPSVVDVDTFALGNTFECVYGTQQDYATAIIDIGATKACCTVMYRGQSLFTRDVPIGGSQLSDAIQENVGLESLEAEKIKISGSTDEAISREVAMICNEYCGMWAEEFKKALLFYNDNTTSEQQIKRVFLCGGAARMRGLDEKFKPHFQGLEVSVLNPFMGMNLDKNITKEYIAEIAPQYAIALGLALRTA